MALTLANLQQYLHKDVGLSDWLAIDQGRIDRFAECTGDRSALNREVIHPRSPAS